MSLNRNKKSLALDLKSPGGLEILHRLVGRADVFVQSLRSGAIDELGLDFAGASRINPRIVYCSITAFGARGPLSHLPGYDPLMQAYSGLMSVNGHPDQEPARVGTSIIDMEYGVTNLDCSIGGLGGCPFAPGASGNVCSEDLVHCLAAMGVETGIDLDRLIAVSRRVQEIVGRPLPGQIVKAGKSTRRYPVPDTVAGRIPAGHV